MHTCDELDCGICGQPAPKDTVVVIGYIVPTTSDRDNILVVGSPRTLKDAMEHINSLKLPGNMWAELTHPLNGELQFNEFNDLVGFNRQSGNILDIG